MSTSVPDLTGRKIGEYEIVSRIGVGGMGAVYEGRQPLIGKRVAVKVLLPTLSNEAELVERFLHEARAANEIRHRGIVDIFSFGQLPEGAHYFVMELLQGEGFEEIIKDRAPLPLAEALAWTEEALDALDAAHEAGIIHRDIKPSNLFLVNTGRGRPYVKLLDFGIAKLGMLDGESTPQTHASVILGTPDYISPEQARGKDISPQTDLYAMGCVLFEMVTGQRLFKSDNLLATMWAHVEDPPPVPSTLRPDLPPALDHVILWALEKSGPARPPSAAAMRDALAEVRASLGPGAMLTPTPSGPYAQRALPGHTPPPSVRSRVLASTPAPSSTGERSLGTPAPGSGGQSSISGRRPAARAMETKLSPLTRNEHGTDRAPPGPLLGDEVAPTNPETAIPAPARSLLPMVLVGLVVLLAVALVALFAFSDREDDRPVVASRPQKPAAKPPLPVAPPPQPDVAPPPQPDVAPPPPQPDVAPPPPQPDVAPPPPQPDVAPPPPKPDVAPPPPKPRADPPKPRGVTAPQLQARLAKLEQKLAAREAETGEKDRVLRQFLDQARKDIAAASTDAQRREAARFLDEIQRQFGR